MEPGSLTFLYRQTACAKSPTPCVFSDLSSDIIRPVAATVPSLQLYANTAGIQVARRHLPSSISFYGLSRPVQSIKIVIITDTFHSGSRASSRPRMHSDPVNL